MSPPRYQCCLDTNEDASAGVASNHLNSWLDLCKEFMQLDTFGFAGEEFQAGAEIRDCVLLDGDFEFDWVELPECCFLNPEVLLMLSANKTKYLWFCLIFISLVRNMRFGLLWPLQQGCRLTTIAAHAISKICESICLMI